MEQHGEPAHLALDAFGDEENRAETLLEGVAQLFGDGVDLLGVDGRKAAAQDFLNLGQGAFVHRQNVVVNTAVRQHGQATFA